MLKSSRSDKNGPYKREVRFSLASFLFSCGNLNPRIKKGNIPIKSINWNAGIADTILNSGKFDRYSSVQNATLYNPRIDNDNNFSATIIDYYNFNKKPWSANMPDNWGYKMQQNGNLENYYNLIEITKNLKK